MTAGMSIIHGERATEEFIAEGGVMAGIQLWMNLSPENKLAQPKNQDIKGGDLPGIALAKGSTLRIVTGQFGGAAGAVKTREAILAWQLTLTESATVDLPVPQHNNLAAYLLDGEVTSSFGFDYAGRTLLHYPKDGEGIRLTGKAPITRIIILGGEPIGAPVVSSGPLVMNNQTQIMETMRDYRMKKIGFYIAKKRRFQPSSCLHRIHPADCSQRYSW